MTDPEASERDSLPDDPGTATAGAPEMHRSLASTLAGVAGYVGQLPRGDRAMLRRLQGRFGDVPPEPFWRIVQRYDIAPGNEDFWLRVLPLMVRHPYEPGRSPGKAMCRSGVSPSRLERWLRRDSDTALAEADRVLSQLDEPVDWVELGMLLYHWDHPQHGDRNRRRFARDYFLTPECRRPSTTDQGGR